MKNLIGKKVCMQKKAPDDNIFVNLKSHHFASLHAGQKLNFFKMGEHQPQPFTIKQ